MQMCERAFSPPLYLLRRMCNKPVREERQSVRAGGCAVVCRIALVAKRFAGQTDSVEKWYGTMYKLEPIAETVLQVA